LGLAIGTAAGVKLASPEKLVVGIVGDGSMKLGSDAVHLLSRHKQSALFLVFDNGGFSWPKLFQKLDDIETGVSFEFKLPNVPDRVNVLTITDEKELKEAFQTYRTDKGVTLFYISISPDNDLPPGVVNNYL
jgi:acetolactate synthase-1/2/3 large subunit